MVYDLLLLDFDGTLFDTRRAIAYSLQRTFEHFGEHLPEWRSIETEISSGKGLGDVITSLAPSLGSETSRLLEWKSYYRQVYEFEGEAHVAPFEGVIDSMYQLSELGVQVVVTSNKGEAAVERTLERFSIRSVVDLIVADSPGVKKKPDPDSYYRLIRPVFPNTERAKTLVVGDTDADLQFAKRARLFVCWAQYGYGDPVRCQAVGYDHAILRIGELLSIL